MADRATAVGRSSSGGHNMQRDRQYGIMSAGSWGLTLKKGHHRRGRVGHIGRLHRACQRPPLPVVVLQRRAGRQAGRQAGAVARPCEAAHCPARLLKARPGPRRQHPAHCTCIVALTSHISCLGLAPRCAATRCRPSNCCPGRRNAQPGGSGKAAAVAAGRRYAGPAGRPRISGRGCSSDIASPSGCGVAPPSSPMMFCSSCVSSALSGPASAASGMNGRPSCAAARLAACLRARRMRSCVAGGWGGGPWHQRAAAVKGRRPAAAAASSRWGVRRPRAPTPSAVMHATAVAGNAGV